MGARGRLATLSVPASVSRTEVGIAVIIEGSAPNMYAGPNNPNLIALITNSLSRQADEVGV